MQSQEVIHVLLGKANPERQNGLNKAVDKYAETAISLGLDCQVWGITQDPDAHTPKRPYKLRLFPKTKSRFLLSRSLVYAIQEKQHGQTVFHLHGGFTPELWQISKLLTKYNIPYIISPHGVYSSGALATRSIRKKLYLMVFENSIIKNARKIHVLVKGELSPKITNIVPPNKIAIIPNGQDSIDIEKPEQPYPGKKPPVFVFCGRLQADHKGLDLLISGFAKYKHSGGTGCLTLIGDGPDKSYLEKMALELGVARDIEFTGAKYGDDKNLLIVSADGFVLTSRWEGLPLALLEAVAMNVPVLVSKGTNFSDYVREFNLGIALKNNTAEEISQAFHRFKHDEHTYTPRAVLSELNWESIVRKMALVLYKESNQCN